MKGFLREEFMPINAYIENQRELNLMMHLKVLEKQKQNHHKVNRKKEIIKIRVEINEMEIKRTKQRINKTKSWFFE
jgi:hypothetical protein